MNLLPSDATAAARTDHPAREAPAHRRRRRSWVMRIARIFALVYLGVGTLMFSLQTRIIFPGQESQGQPYAVVRPRPGTELVRLQTADGLPIVAHYGPAIFPDGGPDPDAADRPTLLYFYGNGMCLNHT